MRKLTQDEIVKMSKYLHFTEQESAEIADIFYLEKLNGNYRLNYTKLDNFNDYIIEWENHWYRYNTWKELLQSEDEQADGLTASECEELQGSAIFRLTTGMYIQTVA